MIGWDLNVPLHIPALAVVATVMTRAQMTPVLPVGVTLDHRVLDGYQAGRLARRLEAVVRDPEAALPR